MNTLPSHVRPGDLLFERGSGWIAWSIKKFTHSQFSHVAIVVDQNTVIEAWPDGVRQIPNPYKEGDYEIRTLPDLSDMQRLAIVRQAQQFLGTPYDYARIFALLVELLFHLKNRLFSRGHIICSVYAPLAYLKGGGVRLCIGKAISHLTPEDVFEDPRLQAYA